MVDETQISKPPEPTMIHNSIKLWILLPLRAELLFTLQYEIPCTFEGKIRVHAQQKSLLMQDWISRLKPTQSKSL